MSSLYLDRKNLSLKTRNGTLVVYQNGVQQSTVPLKMLERVIARADVELSTSVLTALAAQGIAFTAIGGRRGERVAQLTGTMHNDACRRLEQYRAFNDPAARLELAKEIVRGKLQNQHRFASMLLVKRPDVRSKLFKTEKVLANALENIERAEGIENLLGHEGAAASAHFQALEVILPPRLNFTGRNRRPPRDPVNACLSLTYTLAHSDATQACLLAGLDPAIGMLHEPAYGRASLAADLVEPLRPHIDEWVWGLFRDRVLDQHHFGIDNEACLLKKGGRQIFYAEWEQRAPVLRRWLRQQSRVLLRLIEGEKPNAATVS